MPTNEIWLQQLQWCEGSQSLTKSLGALKVPILILFNLLPTNDVLFINSKNMQSHIYLFNYTVTVILGNAFGNLGEEGLE